MARIHPTAIVGTDCELAGDAEVGAYSLIRQGSIIGPRTVVDAHVLVEHATIGADNQVFFGAAIGGPPQDQHYANEPTRVVIGDGNVIREYVTIHRATGEGASTRLGNRCLIMASSHLGHNCEVGDDVCMATLSGMSGHTIIEDRVVIGGMVGSHQWVRIGTLAMVSGYSKISMDVPPFSLVDGKPARVVGPNVVGLRRSGLSEETRRAIQHAFRIIYRSGLQLAEALLQVKQELGQHAEVVRLLDFLERTRLGRAGRQQEAGT